LVKRPLDRLPERKEQSFLDSIRSGLGLDMGVDLGTANTLIFVAGRGVVLAQPSYVAIDRNSDMLLAVGEEAREMLGRAPSHIDVIKPLSAGVIADVYATQHMLREFTLRVHHRRRWVKPRVVVCVPSGVNTIERHAVEQAVIQAGARKVEVVSEPLAAAIGAGLPVYEARGSMVIDIGGGTTEVAAIVMGSVLASTSLRVAGNAIDAAISTFIRKQHGIVIGDRTAEKIKMQAASAVPGVREVNAEILGRDLTTGKPRTVRVTAQELREAIAEPVSDIVDAAVGVFDRLPAEIVRDLAASGVVMTGGGALLPGLDRRFETELGVSVRLDPEPLTCVARGAGLILEGTPHETGDGMPYETRDPAPRRQRPDRREDAAVS
jgi:rod shape-determining protein MreB